MGHIPRLPHYPTAGVARVIAITNQKGGVGKTTTAVNLAASLAAAEQRTLLIDADPQGNATSGLGVTPDSIANTTYEALLDICTLEEAVLRGVHFAKLDLIPATPDLAGAEVELVSIEGREHQMRHAIATIRDQYDFILIDCPPSLGLITINMLTAADGALIPLQCEYFALEGISHLLKTIELIQKALNPALVIDGVLLTMFDARLNLSRQVAADTRAHFGDKVFNAVVPRNVRLAEAPSFGKPIISYDITSVGSSTYLALAKEVIERQQTHVSQQTPHATGPDISTPESTSAHVGSSLTDSPPLHDAPR
jgi:chromosome partitioning protein